MSRTTRILTSVGGLFVAAYLAVNVVNTAVTLIYGEVANLPLADELGLSWREDPAYQATVPWHVLLSTLIFVAAALLLRRYPDEVHPWRRAAVVGAWWAGVTIVIDAIIYVLILGATRWGLPPGEYYIGNQPWITLTYLGVFLAPLIATALRRPIRRALRPQRNAL